MKYNTEMIRQNNINSLRTALKNSDVCTKNSLSELTNLSVATCGSILNDLIVIGEVIELDLGKPRGGRPSRQFKYNFNYSYILNIYVGIEDQKEYLYYEVINLAKEIMTHKKLITGKINLHEIDLVINELIHEFNRITKIAISLPGVVKNGFVYSCDIAHLEKVDLGSFLEEKYSIKTIIENDVNTLAFGALLNGKQQNCESSVYIYYPEKELPGMGVIINNRLIRGFKNFAGEIKTLPIQNSGKTGKEIQSNHTQYINYIFDTVKSINAVINPGNITISISNISEKFKSELTSRLSKIDFIGNINYESSIHDTMILGLRYLTTT